jgi:hypothetical protein
MRCNFLHVLFERLDSCIPDTVGRVRISPVANMKNRRESDMTGQKQYNEEDPRHHTLKLKQMLTDTAAHAREDVSKVSDPKAQALFETTAEVLKGLVKAFDDFEEKREVA